MAKETVQAVRQAEEKAAQIEKDATLKGDAIVLKAKEDAKALVLSMTIAERLTLRGGMMPAHWRCLCPIPQNQALLPRILSRKIKLAHILCK